MSAKSLSSRSLTAVFWGGGGAVVRAVLQIGAQIVLARLLGPEQYGLFAIGAIVLGFSNLLSDIGIAYGLIQKPQVNDEDVRFVITWQFLIGLFVSIAMIAAAGWIAAFFGDARAQDVVRAMGGICLLNALAAPSLNLLKRELDFRRIQLAQVSGYFVGYVLVGIPLAVAGAQVWALVIAWVVQASCTLTLLYLATRHALRPLFWYSEAKAQALYGATVLATNLTNWFINNIDRVVVGRMFPGKQIGLYATGYNLIYSPTSALLGVIQPVFFSASARSANDKGQIAIAYRSLIGCVTLFLLPAFAGLAAVSETFVLALYGAAWQSMGSIITPLALAMPVYLLWGLTTPLLWTGGEVTREFRSQLPLAILWLGASWFAATISPAAVGWAVFGLFFVRLCVILRAAIRLLGLTIQEIWQAVQGGLLLSAGCALLLAGGDAALQDAGFGALARLPALIGLGAVLMLLALRFVPGLVCRDVAGLLEKLSARIPNFMARYLRALPVR